MRLFFYYVTHSLLNTIKKLLKTWVAIFVVLMIFGGLVGGFMGMIISSLDKDSDNTDNLGSDNYFHNTEVRNHSG